MKVTDKSYPKGVELRDQIFGEFGIRVYPVSAEDAAKIAAEFKLKLPDAHQPSVTATVPDDGGYFYINGRHGEIHELLFTDKELAISRAKELTLKKAE
jgi:hypothetical protein